MRIIEKLYESDVFGIMDIDRNDKDYAEAVERLIRLEDDILTKFPGCRDLFDDYQSAKSEVASILQRNDFASGFRAGAQIALEMIKAIR